MALHPSCSTLSFVWVVPQCGNGYILFEVEEWSTSGMRGLGPGGRVESLLLDAVRHETTICVAHELSFSCERIRSWELDSRGYCNKR